MHAHRRRKAFALTDLAALVGTLAILAALAIATQTETRRSARLGEDLASLERFGAATTSFAADNNGLLWGLSWQGGAIYQMLQLDGTFAPVAPESDYEAGQLNMVHLIRLLAGRIGDDGMPVVESMIPYVNYSHLPLLEYLDADPLARWTTSAADEIRLDWQDDPKRNFDNGAWLPLQPEPTPEHRRWPYSMGFRVVPAAWDANQSRFDAGVSGLRVSQAPDHNHFVIPGAADFYNLTLADVDYPAHKVHMHDSHQRHFGAGVQFFGAQVDLDGDDVFADARIPFLTFDAGAHVRSSRDANPGWRPNTPTFPCMSFWYEPNPWEPAAIGEDRDYSHGRYYWTRGGLKGIDFGALHLDTGQADVGECDL
jgi:hypothetical protein